jgi:hypothetical protein
MPPLQVRLPMIYSTDVEPSVLESPCKAAAFVAEKVGFIRLGKIGNPMSRNMPKAGFPLVVYDVNPVAIDWLVKEGDVLRWTRPATRSVGANYSGSAGAKSERYQTV